MGLSHGQLRGAFAGLTYLCNHLRPGVQYKWPVAWRHGPSTQPGQNQNLVPHDLGDCRGVAPGWRRLSSGVLR